MVYGSSHNFEADILRDEYSLKGTLCGRKSELVIVDEVDNMLIDNQTHSTMLARSTPGLEKLLLAMTALW